MIGFHYLEEREKMIERYESGRESKWFSQFGKEQHLAIENAIIYEQLIRCGYTHEQALTFDDVGWIDDNYCLKPHKREEVVRGKGFWCVILTFQLPNKKWVSGHEYTYPSGGSFCNCSIYEKQFDSEKQAKHAEIVHIIKHLESMTYDSEEKVLLPQLKKQAMSCLQLELF